VVCSIACFCVQLMMCQNSFSTDVLGRQAQHMKRFLVFAAVQWRTCPWSGAVHDLGCSVGHPPHLASPAVADDLGYSSLSGSVGSTK